MTDSSSTATQPLTEPLLLPAHCGKRFIALLIDTLIALPGYGMMILPGILLFGFRDSLLGRKKSSIGRHAMDQVMIDLRTKAPPTNGKRFARNLTALLLRSFSFLVYILAELIVSLARSDGRCVTDLMFGVMITELPKPGGTEVAPIPTRANLAA